MAQETYSLLDLDKEHDSDRNAETKYAPFENMLSATHLITSLLIAQHEQQHMPAYAIMGGFSMQLRGGRRSTRDVDLLTTVKMKGVWEAVRGQMRIIIPSSRLVASTLRVFVKTGPPHDSCTESHLIEVDIAQHNSPRSLYVDEVGPFELSGQQIYFDVLSVAQMMRIKVECCLSREEIRDFQDVRFMADKYGEEVRKAIEEGIVDRKELREVLEDERIGDESVRRELTKAISTTW